MSEAARWRECRLGDLLEVKHGFAFKGEYFGDHGSHIVLTPGNFNDEGGFKRKTGNEKWYSGPVPEEYVLKRGDLIVAMTEQAEGLLGSSAIVPESEVYLHNQRLGLVQIRDEHVADRRFIYYLFNFKPVRQQIRASATGVKIRHTAPARIAQVAVSLPPLVVQRRIAGILSAYDELSENGGRRIALLEDMARALYREWFVHFRFPGQNLKAPAPSLDELPEGWKVRKLSDVAVVNATQINSRSAPPAVLYIDISSVSPGRIDTLTPYAFADAPGRARRIVRHGDILWSCVRPNRRSHALCLHPAESTVASTGFAVLSAHAVPYTYLYLASTEDDFVTYLTNRATGAAYPAVTAATFEGAEIIVPPKPLLDRFAEITIPIAEEIHILQRQIENLRETRDLLLPRLLSGQIDLRAD